MQMERVRLPVTPGGHDIPEAKIRERYDRSRWKLIRLLPKQTELRVFDNTPENDSKGQTPDRQLLWHWLRGRIVSKYDLRQMPEWAKPILQAAIESSRKSQLRWR
jgi:hypothetical protein